MKPTLGKWVYFAKKGHQKRGSRFVGNVLGRGYFIGVDQGCYVLYEQGRFWAYGPDLNVTYDLGSNQSISRDEARSLMKNYKGAA